jgi:hypothetical protein
MRDTGDHSFFATSYPTASPIRADPSIFKSFFRTLISFERLRAIGRLFEGPLLLFRDLDLRFLDDPLVRKRLIFAPHAFASFEPFFILTIFTASAYL